LTRGEEGTTVYALTHSTRHHKFEEDKELLRDREMTRDGSEMLFVFEESPSCEWPYITLFRLRF
jgi:hypothetical protein